MEEVEDGEDDRDKRVSMVDNGKDCTVLALDLSFLFPL